MPSLRVDYVQAVERLGLGRGGACESGESGIDVDGVDHAIASGAGTSVGFGCGDYISEQRIHTRSQIAHLSLAGSHMLKDHAKTPSLRVSWEFRLMLTGIREARREGMVVQENQ